MERRRPSVSSLLSSLFSPRLPFFCLLSAFLFNGSSSFRSSPLPTRTAAQRPYFLPMRMQRRASERRASADEKEWTMVEDWALLDAVPEFTVRGGGSGSSETVATFWQQLTAATPALARKSAEEVELRAIELRARRKLESNGTAAVAAAAAAAGPSPQALEQWRRLEDGRFAGRLSLGGSSVAVAVELEGRLASGSEAAQTGGFVVALGGRIYELGEPSAAQLAEEPAAAAVAVAGGSSGLDGSGGVASLGGGKTSLGDGMLRVPWGGVMASSAAAMAGAAVLAGMVGFGAGLASSLSIESEQSQQLQQQQQQSPPPQMSTVTVYRSSSVDPKTFSATSLPMLPPATPQQQQQSLDVPAKVPLTIAEQRKRQEIAISGQELRIEKEEMATARLDMRIKVDKQRLTEQKERLSELRRVEAEKGGDALFELPR